MSPKQFFHLCDRAIGAEHTMYASRMVPSYYEEFEVGPYRGYMLGYTKRISAAIFHADDTRSFGSRLRVIEDRGIELPPVPTYLSYERQYLHVSRALRELIRAKYGEDATFMTRSSGGVIIDFSVMVFEWMTPPPTDTDAVELRLCFG